MTAATIAQHVDFNMPGVEVVRLTASDGETYVCRKLKRIDAVIATSNSDNDADLQATYSGTTVTIRYASQSNKTVSVMIFGAQ